MPDATSLNQPLGSDANGSEVGDFVEDERTSDTIGAMLRGLVTEWLREVMGTLPERHLHVLVRRYDLDDREPAILADLGAELGISRERVRQLQREAERMLAREETGSSVRNAAA
jgi:RNA polymerase primary sigma factor